ncbi:DUF4189 domain-containing protein [Luteibacter aegosomatissinici]|uniref:DUF4189 domain-containing protein n=1 Tax=Luteibacter aegosomatissinici TaxID=2911539 RepID=UPI003CCD02DA
MMKFLLVLILLACSSACWAEGGCPPGQYPQQGQGWRSCVPMPGQANGQQNEVPARWADRWQAIATDTTKAVLGTSKDLSSMSEAEGSAMTDCKSKGGTDCRIAISYANGCIAMSVGTTVLSTGYGISKSEAEKSAAAVCTSKGDSTCSVYYSECSYAQRLQ